jgi:hypothetical protein
LNLAPRVGTGPEEPVLHRAAQATALYRQPVWIEVAVRGICVDVGNGCARPRLSRGSGSNVTILDYDRWRGWFVITRLAREYIKAGGHNAGCHPERYR